MTVALLAMWGDQPPGTLYTTDAATEAAMITAKVATATLTNAAVWTPQVGSSSGAPLTFPQQDALAKGTDMTEAFSSAATSALGTATDDADPLLLLNEFSGRFLAMGTAINVESVTQTVNGVVYHRNIHRNPNTGRIIAVSALGLGATGVVNGY